MKILVVSSKYYPEYSGSGFRAHKTYKRLEGKYSINYDVVSSSLEQTGVQSFIYEDANVTRIAGIIKPFKYKGIMQKVVVWINFPFEVFRCWLYIRTKINNYDLVHTFGNSWAVGYLTWYFAKHNKSVLRELCNDVPSPYYPKRFQGIMKSIFNSKKSMVVAISPMLEKMAKQHLVKNIWQRPNPVEINKFSLELKEKKYLLRKKITHFDDKDIVLASVANFSQRKNQNFLIHILSLLPKKFKLVLAGVMHDDTEGGRQGRSNISSESYLNQIRDDIIKFDLESRVIIKTGFVEDPQNFMALADVYLFPSKHEGLGTPILESQVCGTPVISNHLPGISDYWIKDGVGGYSCILEPQLWINRIMDSLKISEEVLHKNSKNILSYASSDIIDQEYFDLLNQLVD
jgi:glycosyltransferase involved in cell wall biosynthesis